MRKVVEDQSLKFIEVPKFEVYWSLELNKLEGVENAVEINYMLAVRSWQTHHSEIEVEARFEIGAAIKMGKSMQPANAEVKRNHIITSRADLSMEPIPAYVYTKKQQLLLHLSRSTHVDDAPDMVGFCGRELN